MSHNAGINGIVQEILATYKPRRILDVACGFGQWRQIYPAEWVGVDVWLPYLERGLHETRVQADAFQLPFGDRSFDVALCAEVLEHVHQPCALVNEAKRVSSLVVATLPTHPLSRHAQDAINGNPYERHITQLSPQDLKRLGFDVTVYQTLDPKWDEFLIGVCKT